METAFPFAAFQRKEHFAAAVQIAEPFRIFRVLEVRPHIVVHLFKYFKTFPVTREPVSFKHGYQGLDMHPPELLVPLQLLRRKSLAVHEVEYAAVLLVLRMLQPKRKDAVQKLVLVLFFSSFKSIVTYILNKLILHRCYAQIY